ncbi:uncharacterized protein [Diabrotica undecimpunctata]|uniref:uncharacterized protein n=1 Tax=Diabrotica undecimpunctata TaxID=50387 RepID=UPI003B6422FF
MYRTKKKRPPVPSTSQRLDHCSDQTTNGRGGAKNPWVRPGCHKMTIWLCSYNILTLTDDNRFPEIESELKDIKWDILGICETRRKTDEHIILKNGTHFMHKGGEYTGVGFLVKQSLTQCIEEFKPISDISHHQD